MPDTTSDLARNALGFVMALAIGFLVGRTREPSPTQPPRPGVRDFLIISLLGAIAGYIQNSTVFVALFVVTSTMLLLMRAHHPERSGITTELAALATFIIASLCVGEQRQLGAALGIVLATIVARRTELRRFVREGISDDEYVDTLSFLGLIFIIYPLLPKGGFGPFGFFEPRRIWMFVILVSGVSYVGYFLTKFSTPRRGAILTAIVGALASTTAYTTGLARAVRESPESALESTRVGLVGNSIMFPRMLVVVGLVSPALAAGAAPSFAAMTLAGFIAAILLGGSVRSSDASVPVSTFRNPFSLWPALEFGFVFTVVLLLTQVGKHYLGDKGQLVVAAMSGVVDVDAISIALSQFVGQGSTAISTAVEGMILAAATNAVFKSAVVTASGQKTFYFRMMIGFVAMFVTGAVVLFLVSPEQFARLVQ